MDEKLKSELSSLLKLLPPDYGVLIEDDLVKSLAVGLARISLDFPALKAENLKFSGEIVSLAKENNVLKNKLKMYRGKY